MLVRLLNTNCYPLHLALGVSLTSGLSWSCVGPRWSASTWVGGSLGSTQHTTSTVPCSPGQGGGPVFKVGWWVCCAFWNVDIRFLSLRNETLRKCQQQIAFPWLPMIPQNSLLSCPLWVAPHQGCPLCMGCSYCPSCLQSSSFSLSSLRCIIVPFPCGCVSCCPFLLPWDRVC